MKNIQKKLSDVLLAFFDNLYHGPNVKFPELHCHLQENQLKNFWFWSEKIISNRLGKIVRHDGIRGSTILLSISSQAACVKSYKQYISDVVPNEKYSKLQIGWRYHLSIGVTFQNLKSWNLFPKYENALHIRLRRKFNWILVLIRGFETQAPHIYPYFPLSSKFWE